MKFHIYHTNDIHNNYAALKQIHAYLKENRQPEDLYLDSGDFADLKGLIVQADRGMSAFELFMTCGPDAIAVGNNETDGGYDWLQPLASRFPLLSANMTDASGREIPSLPAAKLLERGGRKLLVIGLSPFYNARMENYGFNSFLSMIGLQVHRPEECLRFQLDCWKGQYDDCIVLSHSGSAAEAYLQDLFPEVDLWLGGHSHEVLTGDRYSQSGKGKCLGRITVETSDSGLTITENVQLSLPEAEDPEFDRLLAEKTAYANRVLSRELPVLEELPFDPFRESRLINFICDSMKKLMGGDLAIMHAGIAEYALLRPVSKKSLLQTFPSKLNPTIIYVRGDKIAEAVRLSFDEAHIRQAGKGPGSRGHVLGTLGYSANVRVMRAPFGITVDGEPLDETRVYRLVTDDYLQRGTGYHSLRTPNEEAKYHVWYIRDMMEHFLEDGEIFRLSEIRRVY